MTIRVEGARELRAALKQLEDTGARTAVKVANRTASEIVADRAALLTPRRSGRLERTVRALASQTAGRVRAGTAGVAYAAAIHWGRKTGNVGRPRGNHPGGNPIAGVPFLTVAAKRSERDVIEAYREAINDIIERTVGGS